MKKSLFQLQELLDVYETLKNLHSTAYILVSNIRDSLRGKQVSYNLKDATNFVYVMREIIRYCEDIRRELDAVRELLEQWGCAKYVVENLNDPGKSEPIRASLATGTPKIDIRAKLPKLKEDPDAYYALMEHLGVSKDDAEKGIVRPHWPKVQEYISLRATEGKPLPPGCQADSTYPVYSMQIKAVHDLGEFVSELAERRSKGTDKLIEQMLAERTSLQRESKDQETYE
jgi:hypothetical protein